MHLRKGRHRARGDDKQRRKRTVASNEKYVSFALRIEIIDNILYFGDRVVRKGVYDV